MHNDLSEAQKVYFDLLIKAGCKVKFKTEFWGKEYVWFTDPNGSYFLERMPNV